MEWLTQNWIWVALIGGMIAMHLFGHRGHGGHGGHRGGCGGGHGNQDDRRGPDRTPQHSNGGDVDTARADRAPSGHRH
jgi:hypothetical protein